MSWQEKAAQVAAFLSLDKLHPEVLDWAARRRKTDVWCVAFSGGADSLALLLALWAHWPEPRKRLVALHFNHRLRGRESVADEKFCRKVCAALRIRLRVGRWPGRHPNASEAEARAVRHVFFAKEMKRCRSRALWLAHQQDDVAETMLMRLARGSGLGGLAAPRPVQRVSGRPTHLRPLLSIKKKDLGAALRHAGADWREDSTNASDRYFRNRVRRDVIPAWTEAAGRDALAGAARSRELLAEDDEALEAWAEKLAAWERDRKFAIKGLMDVPKAVSRRVLHRWLMAVKAETDLSRQGFDLLLSAVLRGEPTRFSLGRKAFAVISRGELSLQRG